MRNVIYAKGNFVVIKNKRYITVVNKKPISTKSKQEKRNHHCHLNSDELVAAKMLANWAYKIDRGFNVWPNHYPNWLQERLERLLYGETIKES